MKYVRAFPHNRLGMIWLLQMPFIKMIIYLLENDYNFARGKIRGLFCWFLLKSYENTVCHERIITNDFRRISDVIPSFQMSMNNSIYLLINDKNILQNSF